MKIFLLTVIALLFAQLASSLQQFTLQLSPLLSNNVVLQKAPHRPQVWGYGEKQANITVAIIRPDTSVEEFTTTVDSDGFWKVKLNPQEPGLGYGLVVSQSNSDRLTVQDVAFGDVWICSGQSNMELHMSAIFNSTAEIDSIIQTVPEMRFMYLKHVSSHELHDDLLIEDIDIAWTKPADWTLGNFPALCALYGAELQNKVGYPIGLIASVWGGTFLEAWSAPEGLSNCAVQPLEYEVNNYLFNAMIYPLTRMSVTGAIWYQGENNAGYPSSYQPYNLGKYWCTFREMINDWRSYWNRRTDFDTLIDFPFGFVQLAGFTTQRDNYNWPLLRWHQTHDVGYVPNENMPNTFMAVAVDTDDSEGDPLHPRDKVTPAKRLALAAYHQHYLNTNFTIPHIEKACWNNNGFVDIQLSANVKYTSPNEDTRAFTVCCGYDKAYCQSWMDVPVTGGNKLLVADVSGAYHFCDGQAPRIMGYLYSETPCPHALKCPAYITNCEDLSDECFGYPPIAIPLSPWIGPIVTEDKC